MSQPKIKIILDSCCIPKCRKKCDESKFCTTHAKEYTIEEENCCICLEALSEETDQNYPLLSCGHWIHYKCIAEGGKEECPICRKHVEIPSKYKRQLKKSKKDFEEKKIQEERRDIEEELRNMQTSMIKKFINVYKHYNGKDLIELMYTNVLMVNDIEVENYIESEGRDMFIKETIEIEIRERGSLIDERSLLNLYYYDNRVVAERYVSRDLYLHHLKMVIMNEYKIFEYAAKILLRKGIDIEDLVDSA